MKFLISENQLLRLLKEINYNPDVEKIQKDLISKGYNLGSYGPNKDGVDGIAGPLTRAAYKKEYGSELNLEDDTDDNSLSDYGAVLVGGLDYRNGDLDIDSQVRLLKKGLGSDKKVKGFRYSTPTSSILSFMENNPNIPVYLFSAGCKKSEELAKDNNVNKNELYIIEPYAAGKITKYKVREAVNLGVPASNVFVGDSVGRGKGIVNGASSSMASSHWNALTTVGQMTK